MHTLELLQANLLSPMVPAFVLGIFATILRSDLRFPDELYTALSVFLLFAIGLKGGAAMSVSSPGELLLPALASLALGVGTPLWCYAILRYLGRMEVANAAAIAVHYGSVSAVTFIAGQTYLEKIGVKFEGFMPALVALMEVPAIVVGLLIAKWQLGGGNLKQSLHEVLAGKSVVLLVGGLLIGLAAGAHGVEQVRPFFLDPFKGVLTLFLLEMGMAAARRFRDLSRVGAFLLAFGLVMPVLHGLLGVWVGRLIGLSEGGATLLAVLSASASYIAAPAAVRISLPQANPSFYLTASLAITFPFNLTVGVPLYHALSEWVYRGGTP